MKRQKTARKQPKSSDSKHTQQLESISNQQSQLTINRNSLMPIGANQIVQLQRIIGNQAVQRLLLKQQVQQSLNTIQRSEGNELSESNELEAKVSEAAAVLGVTEAELWQILEDNPDALDLMGPKSYKAEIESIKDMEVPEYQEQSKDDAIRKRLIRLAKASPNLVKLENKLKSIKSNATTWFSEINPSATFLGKPIDPSEGSASGVHNTMYECLQKAEQMLVNLTGLTPDELAEKYHIEHIRGLRPLKAATGGKDGEDSGIGLHSFGLAIDIGVSSGPNPDIKKMVDYKGKKVESSRFSVINRANRLVKYGVGEKFDRKNAIQGEGETHHEKRVDQADKWWDIMHDASEAYKIYMKFENQTEVEVNGEILKLEDLAQAHAEATSDGKSVEEWQKQIKADRLALHKVSPKFDNMIEGGFINLDKELVMALVKSGLSWGATINNRADIHHFGLYDGKLKFTRISSGA